jgi:UDP-glucose 4-epimerase
MKKILITGGAGFIGSALVKRFQVEHEVFVYDNLSYGSRNFISIDDDHFIEADILDGMVLENSLMEIKPDWVIHLAAIHFIPDCNQRPFESSKINIQGTKNLLDAVKKVGDVQKIFFASTAAVYPISDHAVSEDDEVNPLDIYGLSKITGEYLCQGFAIDTGIPTIIGRFFNAFGPNETNPHLIPEIEKQLKSGLRTIRLGNLEPKRDFVHTYDMAEWVYKLLSGSHSGFETFNIGQGMEYSVREVVKEFETALGESVQIEQDPARMRKVERMHLLADVRKIIKDTGYEPQYSLSDGIKTLMNEEQAPRYSMH